MRGRAKAFKWLKPKRFYNDRTPLSTFLSMAMALCCSTWKSKQWHQVMGDS